MTMHRLTFYCRCGSSATAASNDLKYAEGVIAMMREGHTGEGHGDTDARTAARARHASDKLLAERDR